MSMNEEKNRQEALLAPFFTAARETAPAPSPDLMARVMADAEAVQAQQGAVAGARPAAPRAGPWARLAQGLGGWPAMAGLGAAGLAGVWIGLSLPETLPGLPPGAGADDYVVDIAPGMVLETGGDF